VSITVRIKRWRHNIPRSQSLISKRAVQYIKPDGNHASAAEASFLTLSHARDKGIWLALYRKLPGFATISELVYTFIAAHRSAFYRISFFSGQRLRTTAIRSCLISVLAPVWVNLPFSLCFIRRTGAGADRQPWHSAIGRSDQWHRQSCRAGAILTDADGVLVERQRSCHPGCVLGGAGLSLLLVFNLLPRLSLFFALCSLSLALLWRADLHDLPVDTFLLEAGFLALLLSVTTMPGIWLLRWLLFRFMFMSGVVKLLSGDPNWWNLSALSYHFLTQPLPRHWPGMPRTCRPRY